MAKINLLPWREELRAELRKEFYVVTGIVAVVAAVIIFAWMTMLNNSIDYQKSRNAFVEKRIAELNQQVREIAEIRKKKNELVARMNVIQSLQGNRPAIVHIFDQIVRTLPDGVYYNEIVRSGNTLTLRGTAESNNRVSSLMRQLDASEWFSNPNLTGVTANRAAGEYANDFQLRVTITPPTGTKE